jgi:hypothetical protein
MVTNVEALKSIKKKEQVVQPVNNTQDKTPDFSYLHKYLFYLHEFYRILNGRQQHQQQEYQHPIVPPLGWRRFKNPLEGHTKTANVFIARQPRNFLDAFVCLPQQLTGNTHLYLHPVFVDAAAIELFKTIL